MIYMIYELLECCFAFGGVGVGVPGITYGFVEAGYIDHAPDSAEEDALFYGAKSQITRKYCQKDRKNV